LRRRDSRLDQLIGCAKLSAGRKQFLLRYEDLQYRRVVLKQVVQSKHSNTNKLLNPCPLKAHLPKKKHDPVALYIYACVAIRLISRCGHPHETGMFGYSDGKLRALHG
ncbi:hypothetical protein PSTT_14809, partial [Puccinia striiformis]